MLDQEASTVLAALDKGWFHLHGYHIALLSEQGLNVDGRVILEACESLSIQKLHSSPTILRVIGKQRGAYNHSNKRCVACLHRPG